MKKQMNKVGAMSHNVWYVDSLKMLIFYRNQLFHSSCLSVSSHNTNFDYWNRKYQNLLNFFNSRGFRVEYIGNLSFILWDDTRDRIIVRADGRNVPVVSGSTVTYLRIDFTWKD